VIKVYADIFREKLHRQKESIRKELDRPASERRREWLKKQLCQTRELKKLVKEMSDEKCPHCGENLN
tara:strand:+ start:91 stop:291 length:201 start_codon:yes stop_codon:yes gene_type:complete